MKYIHGDFGEFPNLEKLLSVEYSDELTSGHYTGLNVKFLEDCLKGMRVDDRQIVKFWYKKPEAPVKMTVQKIDHYDLTAMIMPVRIQW